MLCSYVKQNAENGGYAIGAFNVYNLEGIEAVVEAAEEENSPAILQVSFVIKKWNLGYVKGFHMRDISH